MNNKIIVFGGAGKFGRCIIENLRKQTRDIVNITDTNKEVEFAETIHYEDQRALEKIMTKLLSEGYDTIIFAHRAKGGKQNYLEELNRELIPYYATDKAIQQIEANNKCLNIVSLNSFAALKINLDISLSYHVAKAATLQAARVIGIQNKQAKVTSNIVMFGEVMNEDRLTHDATKDSIYEMIKQRTTNNRIATYQSVVNIVNLLVRRKLPGINREIIQINEGIERFSFESIIRGGIVQ
ncbi:SDR family oxidoreductase [Synechococcus sp. UW179B]|uniref:SDR family oxidoreductase n=1 Tax=Synechococcus sp. UW179B TaxID=2575516 RepID=UPI000E0F71A0|nr:SDR family oxidoreductase [Synechococcus sp. UW179B]